MHTQSSSRLPSLLLVAVLGATAMAATSPGARAEAIVGLTASGNLIRFDSSAPGTVASVGAVTGLVAGDTLVGIDRRPSLGPNNGVLYGVGVNLATGSARIYTLNETSAVATPVATLAADPADATVPFPFTAVSGSSFGVDFNPVVDRLRVVSNTGQNLRINVATGLTQLDVPLAYAGGDVNAGDAPVDIAIAYANNFGGATSTTLRGVDVGQDTDALVVHSNPNGGVLTTAASLPFNSTTDLGYDISGLSGTPYFAANVESSGVTLFYAGVAGTALLIGAIDIDERVVDIAAPIGAQVVVPEPGTLVLAGTGLLGLIGLRRRRA